MLWPPLHLHHLHHHHLHRHHHDLQASDKDAGAFSEVAAAAAEMETGTGSERSPRGKHHGVIAQQLRTVLPDAVMELDNPAAGKKQTSTTTK